MRDQLASMMEGMKRSLNTAADLLALNLLLILGCVPVVTAGAAWTAGYGYVLRLVRREETGLPFQPWWEAFRANFRRATAAWLLLLACLLIVAGDYYYAVAIAEPVNRFFLVFSLVMAVLLMLAATWLFPLLARFDNSVRGHIKNAVLMTAGMFPQTLLALAIQIGVWLLPLFVPALFYYLGWLWVMFGFSYPMYLTAKLFRKPLDSEPRDVDVTGQD